MNPKSPNLLVNTITAVFLLRYFDIKQPPNIDMPINKKTYIYIHIYTYVLIYLYMHAYLYMNTCTHTHTKKEKKDKGS